VSLFSLWTIINQGIRKDEFEKIKVLKIVIVLGSQTVIKKLIWKKLFKLLRLVLWLLRSIQLNLVRMVGGV
jgi:hypothetical protein